MFNIPYRLRRQTKFEIPVGPNLADAPILDFDVDGTKIKIKIPKGTSVNYAPSRTAPSKIALSKMSFDYSLTNKPGWNSFSLLFRSWDFCGDWFLGRLGRVTAGLSIVKPDSMKHGTSFFHPSVFEAALTDYFFYRYGDEIDRDEKTQDWLVPLDWVTSHQATSFSVLFKAVRTLPNHPEGTVCYFSCPIDDDKIVIMACGIARFPVFIHSVTSPEKNINEWVSDEPMLEFVGQLLRGVQVELSSHALQRRSKALECSPGAEVSREFSPVKFI